MVTVETSKGEIAENKTFRVRALASHTGAFAVLVDQEADLMVRMCVCVCMHVHVCMYVCACVCMYLCACVCACMHVYKCVHVRMYACHVCKGGDVCDGEREGHSKVAVMTGGECPDHGGECPDHGGECPDHGGECPDHGGECPDHGGECPDHRKVVPINLDTVETSRE